MLFSELWIEADSRVLLVNNESVTCGFCRAKVWAFIILVQVFYPERADILFPISINAI